ncbi:Unknown protein sequence [Pseudomonas amygdali pv. myricae]|nr:Unknown protein sequence [Pseudomonas amygdali pv. myricae]
MLLEYRSRLTLLDVKGGDRQCWPLLLPLYGKHSDEKNNNFCRNTPTEQ